mgnify:CR=1 FL=1
MSLARDLHGGHRSGSWQCCVTEEAYRNGSRQATGLLVVRHERARDYLAVSGESRTADGAILCKIHGASLDSAV